MSGRFFGVPGSTTSYLTAGNFNDSKKLVRFKNLLIVFFSRMLSMT